MTEQEKKEKRERVLNSVRRIGKALDCDVEEVLEKLANKAENSPIKLKIALNTYL